MLKVSAVLENNQQNSLIRHHESTMLKQLPMKTQTKQKQQKASAVAPKIGMTKQMANLVANQSTVVESVLNGTAYIEKNRWHGRTSVYDTHRISKFLNNTLSSGSLDMKRFTTLAKEIPTFHKVLGPNLSRMIAARS